MSQSAAGQRSKAILGRIRTLAAGRSPAYAVAATALWIPAYQLWLIVRGTPLQSNDYYWMLQSIYDLSGDFRWKGVLVHGNEHLVAVPKLLYAVNYELFGGSNVTLGVAVWAVSAMSVVVLVSCIRRWVQVSATAWALILWSACACLFPLQAQHNFRFSMSGAAWLTANFFSICAVAAYLSNRPYRAAIAGVLAVFSYGTGLVVWLPLAVRALRRRSKADVVLVAVGVGAIATERVTAHTVSRHPDLEWNPLRVLQSATTTFGAFFSGHGSIARVLGFLLLGALLVGLVLAVRRTDDRVQSLAIDLALYAGGAVMLIGVARTGLGGLGASRYMGLVGLALLAGILLWWRLSDESDGWRVATGAAIALAVAAGTSTVLAWAPFDDGAALRAAAIRLGVGYKVQAGYQESSTELLSGLRHYPFNESFDADCGLLDTSLDMSSVTTSPGFRGVVDEIEVSANPQALLLEGRMPAAADPDCIVVVDAGGTVAGIGVLREVGRPKTPPDADGQPMKLLQAVLLRDSIGGLQIVAVSRDRQGYFAVADVAAG